MIKVQGYRVLVKADDIERTYGDSNIVVVHESEDREKSGIQTGLVVGVGGTCWTGDAFNGPWCEEGDRILFSKHSGRFIMDPDTEEEFLIMNDTDILAVLGERE